MMNSPFAGKDRVWNSVNYQVLTSETAIFGVLKKKNVTTGLITESEIKFGKAN